MSPDLCVFTEKSSRGAGSSVKKDCPICLTPEAQGTGVVKGLSA